MGDLTLVVPMPPNLANSRMHWRVKHKAKAYYWAGLDALQQIGSIPKPPRVRWPAAEISTVMYLGRSMDMDNAMARHKWVLDWLVTRGYVSDDKTASLRWKQFPEQITKNAKPYRIEITLTPCWPSGKS